jgi:hypothetical protein
MGGSPDAAAGELINHREREISLERARSSRADWGGGAISPRLAGQRHAEPDHELFRSLSRVDRLMLVTVVDG